jgi:hypothetical protein
VTVADGAMPPDIDSLVTVKFIAVTNGYTRNY